MSSEAAPQDGVTVNYSAERVIGNGSFGVVFQATVAQTGEVVAIKKVLQDKRFKNRELQIMRKLNHPNIVLLRHCFYSNGEKSDELYLNLVLEYVPETISKVSRHYHKNHKTMPQVLVKLYTFQICRALAYIHALGICHRDIKPQNILVDPATHVVKLCDFGSAKVLVVGEPNVSYICSRYYRSPELIFGSTDYSTAIDIWSLGCVCAELMLAHPMFPGENGVAQLVEIIKVLGTPTRGEIESMNQNYSDFKFPQIKPHPWEKVFKNVPPNSKLLDLVPRMLSYSPASRITPIEALTHDAFDELFRKDLVLPNGRKVPELLNFTPVELKSGGDLLAKFR